MLEMQQVESMQLQHYLRPAGVKSLPSGLAAVSANRARALGCTLCGVCATLLGMKRHRRLRLIR